MSEFTLSNANGMVVRFTNVGMTLLSVMVPSQQHGTADVVLAAASPAHIVSNKPNFGGIVGRYANRIAGAKFTLDGREYTLDANNGPNSLHGGNHGLWQQVFTPVSSTAEHMVFSYTSPDGEGGYPGNLVVTVTMSLDAANRLTMKFEAVTDQPTVVNLCNHAYWNLAGHAAPAAAAALLAHTLHLNADHYTPNDDVMIPTGELAPVVGTCFDFHSQANFTLGSRIDALAQDAKSGRGYDLNYAVCRAPATPAQELTWVGTLTDPASGRVMKIHSNVPGVQCYTANWLDLKDGTKDGVHYGRFHGVCLETQNFPNAPNTPSFPSAVVRPGETYSHTVVHEFQW